MDPLGWVYRIRWQTGEAAFQATYRETGDLELAAEVRARVERAVRGALL